MRHPKILYRTMFNTKGPSSYGKGIASNLVTEEERQKYNSGGRVKLADGYPMEGWGWQERPEFQYPFGDFRHQYPGIGGGRTKKGDKWWNEFGPSWNLARMKEYAAPTLEKTDDLESQDIYQGSDPRYFKRKFTQDDWGESDYETASDVTALPPEKIKEQDYEKGEHYALTPDSVVKEDTETLDDPFAFLDESIEKKRKMGRGKALLDAAAAAAEWGTAGTKKERGAAIAKGLRGVGEAGTKFQGAAMDLKDRAKILAATEEIKGKQKRDLFEDRRKGYYEPSLAIQKETLQLKKEAAQLAEEGQEPIDQYAFFGNKGDLKIPQSKATILSNILKRKIYYAKDDETKKLLSSIDNDGVIFVDVNGLIFRNTKGEIAQVDEYQDTEFFGK